MKMKSLLKRYRVDDGRGFRLKDHQPQDTADLDIEKETAKILLRNGVERMAELQEKLYAQDRWSLLLIFQAMDAAGKDSTIKHVLSGLNPQGCEVHAFKAPSGEELDHDFLWRTTRRLPARGHIGIFNRSYYEEVLVVRVHPEFLAAQKLPPEVVTRDIWQERFKDIRNLEAYLGRNGTVVRKFFLNVSREEQKRRFMERIDNPAKNWKFEMADVNERGHWKDYMAAYEEAIAATATPEAPWYVVPADSKWFTRLVVAAAVDEALDDLDLKLPPVSPRKQQELVKARKALLAEKSGGR
jgi:PPK2 family polyphosphate:nucleotide phosphotransferase